MFCTQCGAEASEGQSFCGLCGAPLEQKPAPPKVAPSDQRSPAPVRVAEAGKPTSPWKSPIVLVGGGFIILISLCSLIGIGIALLNSQSGSEDSSQAPAPKQSGPKNSEAPAEPEQAPAPSIQEARGLGITQQFLRQRYEEGLSVKFESSPLATGEPRLLGQGSSGTVNVEIIGDPNNVRVVDVLAGVTDNPQTNTENSFALVGVIKLAAPDWEEGSTWIMHQMDLCTEALLAGGSSYNQEAIISKNRKVLFRGLKTQSGTTMLMVQVEAMGNK